MATEIAKRYRLSNINRNIKGVKWAANKKTLEDIGDIHLDFKILHNI